MKYIKRWGFYFLSVALFEGLILWVIIAKQAENGLAGTIGMIVVGLIGGFSLLLITLYGEEELKDANRTANFLLKQVRKERIKSKPK